MAITRITRTTDFIRRWNEAFDEKELRLLCSGGPGFWPNTSFREWLQGLTMTEKIFSCEQRKGFIRSSVLIRQDTVRDRIDYIYLNHARYGTLEWNKGWKKIHRWEDEDEAQDFSSMNKHFTAISTDGTPAHPHFERAMLDAISADIMEFGTDEEASIFLPVISTLRNDSKSTVMRL